MPPAAPKTLNWNSKIARAKDKAAHAYVEVGDRARPHMLLITTSQADAKDSDVDIEVDALERAAVILEDTAKAMRAKASDLKLETGA